MILKRSRGLAALVLAGLLLLGPDAVGGGGAMSAGDDEMVGTLPCNIPLVLPDSNSNAVWDVAPGFYLEGSNAAISEALASRTGRGLIYQADLGNGRSRISLVGEVQLLVSETLFQLNDLQVGIQTNLELESVNAKVVRRRVVTSSFLIAPDTDYEIPARQLLSRGVFDEELSIYTFSSLHGSSHLSFHSSGGMLSLGQS